MVKVLLCVLALLGTTFAFVTGDGEEPASVAATAAVDGGAEDVPHVHHTRHHHHSHHSHHEEDDNAAAVHKTKEVGWESAGQVAHPFVPHHAAPVAKAHASTVHKAELPQPVRAALHPFSPAPKASAEEDGHHHHHHHSHHHSHHNSHDSHRASDAKEGQALLEEEEGVSPALAVLKEESEIQKLAAEHNQDSHELQELTNAVQHIEERVGEIKQVPAAVSLPSDLSDRLAQLEHEMQHIKSMDVFADKAKAEEGKTQAPTNNLLELDSGEEMSAQPEAPKAQAKRNVGAVGKDKGGGATQSSSKLAPQQPEGRQRHLWAQGTVQVKHVDTTAAKPSARVASAPPAHSNPESNNNEGEEKENEAKAVAEESEAEQEAEAKEGNVVQEKANGQDVEGATEAAEQVDSPNEEQGQDNGALEAKEDAKADEGQVQASHDQVFPHHARLATNQKHVAETKHQYDVARDDSKESTHHKYAWAEGKVVTKQKHMWKQGRDQREGASDERAPVAAEEPPALTTRDVGSSPDQGVRTFLPGKHHAATPSTPSTPTHHRFKAHAEASGGVTNLLETEEGRTAAHDEDSEADDEGAAGAHVTSAELMKRLQLQQQQIQMQQMELGRLEQMAWSNMQQQQQQFQPQQFQPGMGMNAGQQGAMGPFGAMQQQQQQQQPPQAPGFGFSMQMPMQQPGMGMQSPYGFGFPPSQFPNMMQQPMWGMGAQSSTGTSGEPKPKEKARVALPHPLRPVPSSNADEEDDSEGTNAAEVHHATAHRWKSHA